MYHIYNSPIFDGTISFFEKDSSLTTSEQNERIALIASLIFGLLTVGCLITCCYFKLRKPEKSHPMPNIPSLKQVTSESSSDSDSESECINQLDQIEHLSDDIKELEIVCSEQITVDDVKKLPPKITKLNLTMCQNITPEGIEALSEIITELHLPSCDQKLIDADFKKLSPRLKELHVVDPKNITDKCLENLPENLKLLELSQCDQITHLGINSAYKRFTNLEYLDLSRCQGLTDAILMNLTQDSLPSTLETINLSGCNLKMDFPQIG